jgi:hypothetical protein
MNRLADAHNIVLFEMETRRPELQAMREQDRRAWWISAASAPRGAKRLGIRQLAVRLGDLVAGLRCQLDSRFAPEPVAKAC